MVELLPARHVLVAPDAQAGEDDDLVLAGAKRRAVRAGDLGHRIAVETNVGKVRGAGGASDFGVAQVVVPASGRVAAVGVGDGVGELLRQGQAHRVGGAEGRVRRGVVHAAVRGRNDDVMDDGRRARGVGPEEGGVVAAERRAGRRAVAQGAVGLLHDDARLDEDDVEPVGVGRQQTAVRDLFLEVGADGGVGEGGVGLQVDGVDATRLIAAAADAVARIGQRVHERALHKIAKLSLEMGGELVRSIALEVAGRVVPADAVVDALHFDLGQNGAAVERNAHHLAAFQSLQSGLDVLRGVGALGEVFAEPVHVVLPDNAGAAAVAWVVRRWPFRGPAHLRRIGGGGKDRFRRRRFRGDGGALQPNSFPPANSVAARPRRRLNSTP